MYNNFVHECVHVYSMWKVPCMASTCMRDKKPLDRNYFSYIIACNCQLLNRYILCAFAHVVCVYDFMKEVLYNDLKMIWLSKYTYICSKYLLTSWKPKCFQVRGHYVILCNQTNGPQ